MPSPEFGQRERILLGAYACIANWGLTKTTVEDVARESRLSRSTIYRYFPGGREEIIDAVISWQYISFFLRLYEEVHDCETLEELLERGLPFARRTMLEHQVFAKILRTDPGILLPKLTTEVNRTIGRMAEFLIPYLARHPLTEGVDEKEAAGFLAHMVLSLLSAPGRWDLSDPEQVSSLVRAELLAGVASLR
jgi:AcrR family transcriptional regulator